MAVDLVIPGEVAVITGAGAGIGRQIADHLTSAGVDVVINDVDANALEEAAERLSNNEGTLVTRQGDGSDPDVARDLVETAVDRFDRLDIIVNNVGIAGPTKPVEEIEPEEFMTTLEVNLGAMFATTKAAIPHLDT
jgi:NAD(P)-dependent dehydrogenase (short-subunit alcohol dehydrogenase family)